MYVPCRFTYNVHCSDRRQLDLSSCALRHPAAARGFNPLLVTRHVRREASASASAFSVCASSIDDLSVSQAVLSVLPGTVDLDCQLYGDKSDQGVLDTGKLQNAGNDLSRLWSKCDDLATASLASLPLAARPPGSPLLANNHLAVQCRMFCKQLDSVDSSLTPGRQLMDAYVLSSLCVRLAAHKCPLALLHSYTHSSHWKCSWCGVLMQMFTSKRGLAASFSATWQQLQAGSRCAGLANPICDLTRNQGLLQYLTLCIM